MATSHEVETVMSRIMSDVGDPMYCKLPVYDLYPINHSDLNRIITEEFIDEVYSQLKSDEYLLIDFAKLVNQALKDCKDTGQIGSDVIITIEDMGGMIERFGISITYRMRRNKRRRVEYKVFKDALIGFRYM